jgi:peptidoglycan/xylan/chitin deacetylase (PgdA/CDA1 family)
MRYKGIIVTGILILTGIAILLPVYFPKRVQPILMLSFNIINNENLPQWCNGLYRILQKHEIKATIFITGKVVDTFPKCMSLFSSNSNIDIGSSTYNYTDLVNILDYSKALTEVQKGKHAVDNAAKINTSLFKAPYGSTDQNIYSLLTRSGIIADFSYTNQYNIYENGQFIRYDLKAYNGSNTTGLVHNIISSKGNEPILINFDNSIATSHIDSFIDDIRSQIENIHFTNPSEIISSPKVRN